MSACYSSVPKSRWIQLSQEIETAFKGESAATYFVPFCMEEGHRIDASGKLYTHFQYTKTLLRKSGILVTNKKRPQEKEVHSLVADEGYYCSLFCRLIFCTE